MSPRRSATPPGAVVIGGDYKSLGVVRSLGRRGIPVCVLTDDHVLASWSRYCRRSLPWPTLSEAERVSYLLDLAEREGLLGWALFPTGDEEAALMARNRDALEQRYRVTVLTPWQTLRAAYDKRHTYRVAAQIGVDHPRTVYPRNADDVRDYAGPYPAILKPAIRPELNRFTTEKAWPASDGATLVARYAEASRLVDPATIMIQEIIPGTGEDQLSFAAFCRGGKPVSSLVARRTRQWPMDFGRASTYVETIEAPDVEEAARTFLEALHFDGIVELEFKRDARDGRLLLLDVNPRVWGWHTLGRRVGIDFPYLLWRAVNGLAIDSVRGRPGTRWVRGLTDLPTALGAIRAGQLPLGEYLRSLRGPIEYAVLAADDPIPAIVEVPTTAWLAWDRRRASRTSAQPA